MTLQELEQLETDVLTPKQVAPILGCQPYTINVATRNGNNPFPFPILRMGTRIRIPKMPFVKWIKGEI